MILKVECGGTREDGQSMRPRAGVFWAATLGVPGRVSTWEPPGLFYASHCIR